MQPKKGSFQVFKKKLHGIRPCYGFRLKSTTDFDTEEQPACYVLTTWDSLLCLIKMQVLE